MQVKIDLLSFHSKSCFVDADNCIYAIGQGHQFGSDENMARLSVHRWLHYLFMKLNPSYCDLLLRAKFFQIFVIHGHSWMDELEMLLI